MDILGHISLNKLVSATAAAFLLAACAQESETDAPATAPEETDPGEVNVYSGRHYDSDLAIYDAFTEETGIRVNIIEAGGSELIERIAQEGETSPADIFITADAGHLWRADQRGVFQSIDNKVIEERVPEQFRHPNGKWFGLSKRARIVIYNKEQGLPEGLDTYAELADPAYEGMICVRSSSNIYNQSLLASRIGDPAFDVRSVSGIQPIAKRWQLVYAHPNDPLASAEEIATVIGMIPASRS